MCRGGHGSQSPLPWTAPAPACPGRSHPPTVRTDRPSPTLSRSARPPRRSDSRGHPKGDKQSEGVDFCSSRIFGQFARLRPASTDRWVKMPVAPAPRGPDMKSFPCTPRLGPAISGLTAILGLAGSFMLTGTARAADLNARVDSYRILHESAIVGQLDELARLKSVAADPAAISAPADRLQKLLTERGFEARQHT